MTSLGADAYVGTLHYKVLDPPVSGGLQQTLTIGNDTNLPINFNGVPVELSQTGDDRIKIGRSAGIITQGTGSIAIGDNAGNDNQRPGSVAIGQSAGQRGQGTNCIAIGANAGNNSQKNDSICIGGGAGDIRCDDGCIIINGGGISLISGGINRCYINPIRGLANPAGGVSGSLWYNPVLKEVLYNP